MENIKLKYLIMRIINIITTLTFIATANSSDQNLTNKEENQPKSRKILKTFEDKTQCISDDKLFEELHRSHPYTEIVNCERPASLTSRGITGGGEIKENTKDTFLHISGLADCVGVILKGVAYSGAYHVYRADLRETYQSQEINKNGNFAKWLREYREKEIDPLQTQVFIASSCWTKNVTDVITVLGDQSYNVHFMSIPDLQLGSSLPYREILISSKSPYLERILRLKSIYDHSLTTELAIDTHTGAVWRNHFFYQ